MRPENHRDWRDQHGENHRHRKVVGQGIFQEPGALRRTSEHKREFADLRQGRSGEHTDPEGQPHDVAGQKDDGELAQNDRGEETEDRARAAHQVQRSMSMPTDTKKTLTNTSRKGMRSARAWWR